MAGSEVGGHFGAAVAHLGDVDGDGLGDMAVGAPDSSSSWPGGGEVTVFAGATDLDTGAAPAVLAEIGSEWDDFDLGGYAYASDASGPKHAVGAVAGDLDGDGLADLVAGAVHASAGPVMRGGRAYVFYGRATGWESLLDATQADAGIAGVSVRDQLSAGMAIADLDGDAVDELIVGAYGSDATGDDAGSLYLFWGPTR